MPRWAMVIDLDRCTSCGACVAACKNENNVAVGNRKRAREHRSIFWLEMVRVVEGEYPDAQVQYVPRLCFQCDDPPCTRVCPVHATFRSDDGLVGQIYHRCIGCRYCMAACPYTVKKFNWYEPEWTEERRQCFNPDVSLRMKGVVEKCTFCYHRLQVAREEAAAEHRQLNDGDFHVACQDACPANAISFGDLDDENSAVYHASRSTRATRWLEDLGAKPKVIYLSKGA